MFVSCPCQVVLYVKLKRTGTVLAGNWDSTMAQFAYFCHDNPLPLIYCIILCIFFSYK